MEVCTIGHSTRTFEEFQRLLAAHGVRSVADVRGYPGSRRYPQFGKARLAESLPSDGIGYRHLPLLGGRRTGREDSPNGGWRNESFRAYADYMGTPEFEEGLQELVAMAGEAPTAMMCAEAVPWRCHRWLISDALVARGVRVEHILGPGKTRPHSVTEWASVSQGVVSYPPPAEEGAGG